MLFWIKRKKRSECCVKFQNQFFCLNVPTTLDKTFKTVYLVGMDDKFDKTLLGRNIRFLAQRQNAKLGELEAAAGVSAGYVSRLLKAEDGGSSALFDLALCSSEKFGVSLEGLLKMDLSAYLPNELYLDGFFFRLLEQTEKGLLNWSFATREMLLGDVDLHPRVKYFEEDGCRTDEIVYCSAFESSRQLGAASVSVDFGSDGQRVYVTQVLREETGESGYEVYLKVDWDGVPVCCVFPGNRLFSSVDNLFKSASEASHQIQIQPKVRSAVDAFLKSFEQKEILDEDLPF